MKALLTIDWDYFMPYVGYFNLSYLENRRNIDKHWYKLYLEKKQCGIDITKEMVVGKEKDNFWTNISKYFNFSSIDKIIVSDSHKIAYDLAKVTKCEEVYNFDSHTDLGYGGLESLNYEVNCANWLGKLLNEGWVRRGNIILSPYTSEKEEYFKEINESFDIVYKEIDELEERLECLRKKQKSLFCEAMELDRELDKTVFEAFKHLFATIECYKKCKNNERPEKPDKPGRPGCGCKYCCKDR